MKKIILLLVAGALFSCSNETETAQDSADAAIIRLMKTPDKNTLSLAERKSILEHLEKNPQDVKYFIVGGVPKDIPARKPGSAITAKTANYTPGEYMMVQLHQPGTADFGASVQVTDIGPYTELVYGWTIASNLLGIFGIMSYERLMLFDNGPLGYYNFSYKIVSASHLGSGLRGQYGPLGWQETNRNVTYTDNYAWFYTGGDLKQGTASMHFANNCNGNVNSIVYSNGVYSVGY